MSSQFIPFDSIVAESGNDFLSAVYSGDTLYTVWGDTRSGRLNVWFAKTIASTNTTVDINILNESKGHFRMYPNPAQKQLNIAFEKEAKPKQIEVFNGHGQSVYKFNSPQAQHTIDVSLWSSGIYFLKVEQEVERFVVD